MSERTKELRKQLAPEWLLDCVMYDKKQNAIVVAPVNCLKHDITNLRVAQHGFAGKTILHLRLDFDVRRVKIGANGTELPTHSKR